MNGTTHTSGLRRDSESTDRNPPHRTARQHQHRRETVGYLDAKYTDHAHIPAYAEFGTLPETKSDVLGHAIPAEATYPSILDQFAVNETTGFEDPTWYRSAIATFSRHAATRLNAPPTWTLPGRAPGDSVTLQELDRNRSLAMVADVNALKEHPNVLQATISSRGLRDAVHTVAERALMRRISHGLAVRSQTLQEATDADKLPPTLDTDMLSKQPWSSATLPDPTASSRPVVFFEPGGMAVQAGAKRHILDSLNEYVEAVDAGSSSVDYSSPSDVPMPHDERAHHANLRLATEKALASIGDETAAGSATFLQHLHRIAVLLDRRELTNKFDHHFAVEWDHEPYLNDGRPSEDLGHLRAFAARRATKRSRKTDR